MPPVRVNFRYMLGFAKVIQASPFIIFMMRTEHIVSSLTATTATYEEHFKYDTTDKNEVPRLLQLRDNGTAAVNALHESCVIQDDLTGRDLVVCVDAEIGGGGF